MAASHDALSPSESQESSCCQHEQSEHSSQQESKMSRASFLIAVTPGSCLARRIVYSRNSKPVPHKRAPPVIFRTAQSRYQDTINKGHLLPKLVNPDSSFARRHAYSVELKGKSDALSLEMRDYSCNISMLDTWLLQRIVKQVKEKVMERRKLHSVPKTKSCECSVKKASLIKFLELVEKKDALLPETRKYFLNDSQIWTWEKERIAREMNARIDKKFGDLLIPVAALHPSKQFISEAYSWMKLNNVSPEVLYSLIEEHWVSPHYSKYRREITESLLLSELHIHY